jgi:dolichyl-phosphate beta-glucosyltransferase
LTLAIPVIAAYLRDTGRSFEIIVVDDGSPDGTARVTEELAEAYPTVRLLRLNPNRGKGGAVKAGMLAARGKYVLFSDADQSTPISEVEKLLPKLEGGGYDIAIGSRGMAGAQVEQGQVWYRELSGKVFGMVASCLAIRGITDTQCGFKCMMRDVARKVTPQITSDTAIFDIEMLIVATREGCRVAEVPVKWVHDPDTRIPYDLRRSIRIFAELFRIRRAQRVGWPVRANT